MFWPGARTPCFVVLFLFCIMVLERCPTVCLEPGWRVAAWVPPGAGAVLLDWAPRDTCLSWLQVSWSSGTPAWARLQASCGGLPFMVLFQGASEGVVAL